MLSKICKTGRVSYWGITRHSYTSIGRYVRLMRAKGYNVAFCYY